MRHSSSVEDVFAFLSQPIRSFFKIRLPQCLWSVRLFEVEWMEPVIARFMTLIHDAVGEVIPPQPSPFVKRPLWRKFFNKNASAQPTNPEELPEWRKFFHRNKDNSQQIEALSRRQWAISLNDIQYAVREMGHLRKLVLKNCTEIMEDFTSEELLQAKLVEFESGLFSSMQGDLIGTRTSMLRSVARRVVYHELQVHEGLYTTPQGATEMSMLSGTLTGPLVALLDEVLPVLDESLRGLFLEALLQATVDAMSLALLNGGEQRLFSTEDHKGLAADLEQLKSFFVNEGSYDDEGQALGLPEAHVNAVCGALDSIVLPAMAMSTEEVIAMYAQQDVDTQPRRLLARVLLHRGAPGGEADRAADDYYAKMLRREHG